MNPTESGVPKHIGIILDGNRRLARRVMMKPWKGHEWGAKKVEQLFDWALELGIKELTLYAFSVENFNRPKIEFDYLIALFKKEFTRMLTDERLDKYKIKVNFIGRLWKFDEELQNILQLIMDKTKFNSDHIVNFALAYGGQQEVIDATKKIAEQVKSGELTIDEINKETFSDALWLKSEPELIIRTGGDLRTSNFLNFQSAYSEWIFLKKHWPEFEKEDLIAAVEEYNRRERRMGR